MANENLASVINFVYPTKIEGTDWIVSHTTGDPFISYWNVAAMGAAEPDETTFMAANEATWAARYITTDPKVSVSLVNLFERFY